jgi:peptidoglycan/xylan/chitin deacetylase (PgdA/CDA1 family)
MTSPWHGGAAAVATLTFDAETPILAAGRRFAEHPMAMSHQSYGPDVGVPRILDMLDEMAVPATFFVPGWVAEHRPGLTRSIVDRGHEVAHHSYNHRSPVSMTAAEERADFERALDIFAAQGIEIRGHRAALWGASWQTPNLIAEHSLDYDSSLMGDDRPYEICVHPFLSGRPGRIMALRGLIEYALQHRDVRFARCREVAAAVRADASIEPRTLTRPPAEPDIYPD